MEKPYRGLAYHGKRVGRTVKASSEPEDVWEESQDAQRAYPDGGVPTECWAYEKAFTRRQRTSARQPEKR